MHLLLIVKIEKLQSYMSPQSTDNCMVCKLLKEKREHCIIDFLK